MERGLCVGRFWQKRSPADVVMRNTFDVERFAAAQ